MTVRTLQVSKNYSDAHSVSFTFLVSGRRNGAPRRGYLFCDDSTGKIYVMQSATCISSHYTQAQIAETARLRNEAPICEGDEVVVGGVAYVVGRLGDFSDAGTLSRKS